MSKSYKKFLNQANSTGREYADGFSEHEFSQLTDKEKLEVSRILEERAIEGDFVAIGAIKYLDDNIAISIFEKVLNSSNSNLVAVAKAASEAYKLAADDRFLDILFNYLSKASGFERRHCIQFACSIPFKHLWGADIYQRFAEVLQREDDEISRHSIAQKILLEEGVTKDMDSYKSSIKRLLKRGE